MIAMADEYERVLCVKNEVLVFKIPPRPSNRGYKAADWNLDNPDWTGRMKVVAKGSELNIKLEDKAGELFAMCPVDAYPGVAVEAVMDSSRYFVLRIKDPSGRSAFIGMGFLDRGDSFDLNVSLQDHFKGIRKEIEVEKSAAAFDSGPKLDLGFKEGQTIKINIGAMKGDSKPRPKHSGGGGMLLPPPGGMKIAPPPGSSAANQIPAFQSQPPQMSTPASKNQSTSNADMLLEFGAPSSTQSAQPTQQTQDPWGDFTSASSSESAEKGNWVQF